MRFSGFLACHIRSKIAILEKRGDFNVDLAKYLYLLLGRLYKKSLYCRDFQVCKMIGI